MKLRETDNVNEGVSLGRTVDVSDEHGKDVLALQARRGFVAWEEVKEGEEATPVTTTPAEAPPADDKPTKGK